ncbi:MAG: hypothetical protein WCO33_05185 [bacterium]
MKTNFEQRLSRLREMLTLMINKPISKFVNSLSEIYKLSKVKFLVILLSILFTIFVVTVLNYKITLLVESRIINNNNVGIQEDRLTKNITGNTGDPILTPLEGFSETYKKIITTFEPIFENFISNTSDVTGKSIKGTNGFTFNVLGYSDVVMSSGASIRSALYYASRLNLLIVPIMTLLIVIYVFNSLIDLDNNKFSLISILSRVILTVILLITTPAILSLTIQGTNLLTKFFLQDGTLFEFLKKFFDELVKPQQNGNTLQDLLQSFLSSTFSPLAVFQVLPIAIPLMLILLQIIFISFQFIIRYINMYFLACIYPIAVVFNIHPKTQGININFWKTWITLLIHQPFFILGYVIIQDMLSSMLKSGVSLEQIILFVGMLLFLSTINVIVAKIFGDVFTAITNNIVAAAGTAMINKYTNLKSRFTTKKLTTKKTSIKKSSTK